MAFVLTPHRNAPIPHSNAGRMRSMLKTRGPMTAPELAELLGLKPKHVCAQLSDMSRHGVVRKDTSVRPVRWEIVARG